MKKEKMNDKGFSLVELIIVIAIMAVLVVVLAPQYLKYVEKSRVSADATTAALDIGQFWYWSQVPVEFGSVRPQPEALERYQISSLFDHSKCHRSQHKVPDNIGCS